MDLKKIHEYLDEKNNEIIESIKNKYPNVVRYLNIDFNKMLKMDYILFRMPMYEIEVRAKEQYKLDDLTYYEGIWLLTKSLDKPIEMKTNILTFQMKRAKLFALENVFKFIDESIMNEDIINNKTK